MQAVEERLARDLAQAPHQLLGTQAEGHQLLIFARTSDSQGVLECARSVAPREGVSAITARVWRADPRQDPHPCVELELVTAQARRRGLAPKYDRLLQELRRTSERVSPWSVN
jgi:hypothetical protein